LKQRFYLIRDLGILILVLLLLFILGAGLLRLFNKKSRKAPGEVPAVTLALESALKSLIKESINDQENLVENPVLEQAITIISGRLLGAMEPLPYDLEVLVLDSPVVNALAFPGGLIVIYSGLIERLESPEELAAVLAHELGHVVNRDAIKNLARSIGLSTLITLLAGREAEVLVQRIIREVINMRFSRYVESRADDFALRLLAEAGIDPLHLGNALERLKEDKEGRKLSLLKYIDSHPDIDSRLEKARLESKRLGIETEAFNIDWKEVKEALPSPF